MQPPGNRFDLRARRGQAGVRREACEDLRHPVDPIVGHAGTQMVRAHDHVDVHVRVLGIRWRGLRDADDLDAPAVYRYPSSDGCRIGAEEALPVVVRQNCHRRCGFSVLALRNDSPEVGAEPHDFEVVSGDDPGAHAHGLVHSEHGEHHGGELRDTFETGTMLPVVVDLGNGERYVAESCEARGMAQVDEAISVAIGQRPEPDSVHDAEDRSVGANAESERQDEGERISRASREPADCDLQIGEPLGPVREPPLRGLEGAEHFPPGGDVRLRIDEGRRLESAIGPRHPRGRAEPGQGRDGCLLGGRAVLDQPRNRVLEMRVGLLEDPLDTRVAWLDAKESAEILSQRAVERFELPGVSGSRIHTVSRTDSTACAKLPHSRRS